MSLGKGQASDYKQQLQLRENLSGFEPQVGKVVVLLQVVEDRESLLTARRTENWCSRGGKQDAAYPKY